MVKPYVWQRHYWGSRSSGKMYVNPMGVHLGGSDEADCANGPPHTLVSFADGECSLYIYKKYCAIGKLCIF